MAYQTPESGRVPERYVRAPRTSESPARMGYAMQRFPKRRRLSFDDWFMRFAAVAMLILVVMELAGWLPGGAG